MKRSDTLGNLAAALAAFQGEVSNPKNTSKNPMYNSKYAPLDEVLSVVRPILAKNGLAVYQEPCSAGDNIKLTTLLMHKSGEWIETEPLEFEAAQKRKDGVKEINAQGAGSGITYARRYQLSAILGISSEDDDDANHAAGHTTPQQQPKSQPQQQPKNNAQKQQEVIDRAKAQSEQEQQHQEEHKDPKKYYCQRCVSNGLNKEITLAAAQYSHKNFGTLLCKACQDAMKTNSVELPLK